jgi:hypothetical protein
MVMTPLHPTLTACPPSSTKSGINAGSSNYGVAPAAGTAVTGKLPPLGAARTASARHGAPIESSGNVGDGGPVAGGDDGGGGGSRADGPTASKDDGGVADLGPVEGGCSSMLAAFDECSAPLTRDAME